MDSMDKRCRIEFSHLESDFVGSRDSFRNPQRRSEFCFDPWRTHPNAAAAIELHWQRESLDVCAEV